MVSTSLTSKQSRLLGGAPVAVILFAAMLAGCGREQVQVYQVPKEQADTTAAAPAGAQAGADRAAVPARWTLPPGWQEKPASAMRVGSFSFSGRNGQLADVSVIPLGGMPQNELDNVNRWRDLIGLAPIAAEDLSRQTEKVHIGSAEGHLFDMVSTEAKIDDKYRARILGAMLQRGGTTWFFKMTGDDATVADAKGAFKQFLQSVRFAEGPDLRAAASAKRPISTNVRDIPAETVDKPVWKAPANWQEQPASAMLVATFVATDKNGGQARITISSFPGDVGGALANVNRWRAQLGLPAVEAADLAGLTSTLDVGGGKAMLVDMTGTDVKTGRKERMVAAMVPREGNTWFYKLKGDESTAAQERDAFIKFVQTVQYPHG